MSRTRRPSMITTYPNDIAEKAGAYLDFKFAGRGKDKRVARALDVSPDMASLLRRGKGWTVPRLGQVWSLYGREFIDFVFGAADMPRIDQELIEIKAGLARLAERLGETEYADDRGADAGFPSMAGAAESYAGNLPRRAGRMVEGSANKIARY